jgi:hypothetical protein
MVGTPNNANNVFRADIILPVQFFEAVKHRAATKTGEYRLLVAVLHDAVSRFQKYALDDDQDCAEAEQWIMGTEAAFEGALDAPRFSFEFICAALDIDADYLRGGLRRWRETQLKRRRVESSDDVVGPL